MALGVALVGAIIVVGTLVPRPNGSFSGIALAQNPDPQPTGSIQEITASTPNLTLAVGDTVVLSINVIGRQDIEDQRLADDVKFDWSVSGGRLSDGTDGTSASYTAPSDPGIYSVTVSPSSGCIGTGLACTATFRITVRRPGEATGPDAPPRNPEGEIPSILSDSEGEQYQVFTPEEGGIFTGENFSISAVMGIVPNSEIIGLRMAEDGSASNAGMSHHRYTLSGNQYRVFVIDAEGAPISSYNLNGTVTVCIPVPGALRTNISSLEMVNKNSNGTLTVMSSSVRISPSLIICGSTSTLPATIAVGIRGTPPPLLEPDPEPAEILPATGGAVPVSQGIIAWALLVGVALIATGTFASTYRHRRQEGIR
ncbi:MAG: hypothetical protein F4180_03590 [Chloroflexi bacterium]|nr:hypothetical protein [Chloroflexota bacterium]